MENEQDERSLETRLIHGRDGAAGEEGATLPPVYYSTAFEHGSAEAMEAAFVEREGGNIYSRLQNPTVEALETRITEACGARGTLALASGMSAITMGLLALLQSGDELLAGRYLFGGSYTLFTRTLADLGVKVQFFDPREPQAAERLITPRTRGIFLEAIANPAMVVPDLAAYRRICDAHGLPLLVDATLPTPCLFDGGELGADVAFFSASKYLAGPASTVGGLLVDTGRYAWHESERFDFSDFRGFEGDAYLAKLRKRIMAGIGPCLAPMNAFLLLLGLETLPLRMERHGRNAEAVAAFLREHPRVREVLYPGLPDSEFHDLTRSQFQDNCGGMITFRLDGKAHCYQFLNALRLVKRAVNLGDTKSIALHPASTIYGTFWPDEQALLGVSEDMIRLSVGLENPTDLLADLDRALAA
jgi:O-acetylhomoserine (thiol)-lyase